MERNLPQPKFWMATLLLLVVISVQFGLAVPVGILDIVIERGLHTPSPQLERHPLVVGVINLLACGAAIALGLHLNRISFRRAFPIGRITAPQAGAMLVTVLGAVVLLSEVDNVFRALLPPPRFLANLMHDLFVSRGGLCSRVFLLVIVAPLTEELLMRGIILRGLLSWHRPAVAVALTAFLFAVLHLNPWQFLSALFLGTVFGWFYLRTSSVAICVLAHACSNGLFVVFTLLPVQIPGMTGTPDYTRNEFQPWWLDLCGMALLLAGLWTFRRATPVPEIQLAPIPAGTSADNVSDPAFKSPE